jgi:hypothetical protein
LAEAGSGELGRQLAAPVKYGEYQVPAKVFMMERIATLMLATNPAWRAAVHDPLACPLDKLYAPFRLELLCLDALKIASSQRGAPEYREAYRFIRRQNSARSKEIYEAQTKARGTG